MSGAIKVDKKTIQNQETKNQKKKQETKLKKQKKKRKALMKSWQKTPEAPKNGNQGKSWQQVTW